MKYKFYKILVDDTEEYISTCTLEQNEIDEKIVYYTTKYVDGVTVIGISCHLAE